jgi:L-alanine-DL-glutamate epimerase-like enolase superfamily enzyme
MRRRCWPETRFAWKQETGDRRQETVFAKSVDIEGMVGYGETEFGCSGLLLLFDNLIIEFFHLATLGTDYVVMMIIRCHFED